MRLVVDTNVLVSAFLWQGTPGRLIELASEKEVELFTSRTLLDELAATLAKKKLAKPVLATGLTADQMLHNYRRLATPVTARRLARQISRDADDDAVLACALAAGADLIVSGDDDLLTLKHYQGILIATPGRCYIVERHPWRWPRWTGNLTSLPILRSCMVLCASEAPASRYRLFWTILPQAKFQSASSTSILH